MTDDPDLDAAINEIKTTTAQVNADLAKITGVGTAVNGTIIATVDSNGHLRDLKLPRDTIRLGNQLAALILQATAEAEKDARKQAAIVVRPLINDPRVAGGLHTIRETIGTTEPNPPPRQPMPPEEIQAADDAYFERMNGQGWTQ